MLFSTFVSSVVWASHILGTTCAVISNHKRSPSEEADVYTWWHDKSSINTDTAVAADEVRRSRRYNVSVGVAGQDQYNDSFVYESIPRNGNGKLYDPAALLSTYDLADGDGISLEIEEGINMAWSQFLYRKDVDVRIKSTDGSALGPVSNVVIRPENLNFEVTSTSLDQISIRVPYDEHGYRFSVEFQNDVFQYRTNGSEYVTSGSFLVGEEPRNALVLFASPPVSADLIPPKSSADTQVLSPGRITAGTIQAKPNLYFEAGIYWVEKNGVLGTDHIKLDPNTHYVYFEPGVYIKGAIEYTTSYPDFYTVGHGVLSGENYVYMANWNMSYVAVKSDATSLRMIFHQTVEDYQTWHCVGPTLNAPPFNTVDLWAKDTTKAVEDNLVHSYISDYKQVGAFYLQTDGSQIYAGTTQDCFWHVNDDGIKLYHSNANVSRLTIWKVYNDPVIQMGWQPRDVSGVVIDDLRVIHGRWYKSLTVVPSSIIGASPYYADPKIVNASRTISATIKNVVCEGRCPALLRVAPLQNYDLHIENVHFDELLHDDQIQLGQSLVGAKISDQEDAYVDGQQNLTVGIHIKDWTIGETKVDESNWGASQLGQLTVSSDFDGQWTIE